MTAFFKRTESFLRMIKFSHSVFAMPFALISMLLAANGFPEVSTLLWILVAVVAARTAAMCFNRIADRRIDARNPRTQSRALVTGELSIPFAYGALLISLLVFYFSAAMLNYLCLLLATPCLAVLLGYSYTKRFTSYSHFFLGAALGLAPIGAWIAVTGSLAWMPIILGIFVTLWVAGFDVLYSCQDFDFDREEQELFSLPKKLGLERAMIFARRLHALSLIALLLVWLLAMPPLGLLFLLGILGVALLLQYEHQLVCPQNLSRINAAFFTMNGVISIGLFVLTLVDVWI